MYSATSRPAASNPVPCRVNSVREMRPSATPGPNIARTRRFRSSRGVRGRSTSSPGYTGLDGFGTDSTSILFHRNGWRTRLCSVRVLR